MAKAKIDVRRLEISGSVLMLLGSGQYEVISNPLPKDAKLLSMSLSPDRDSVLLYIGSEEFEEDDFNTPLPPPVIKRMAVPYNIMPKDLPFEVRN